MVKHVTLPEDPTETRDFSAAAAAAATQPVSAAGSMPNLRRFDDDEERAVRTSEPVPGPVRPRTSTSPEWRAVLPNPYGRSVTFPRSCYSAPDYVTATVPFLISPFPLISKPHKKKTASPVSVDAPAAREGGTVDPVSGSETTDAEFEHERHLIKKRRRAEFPRRLLTALLGGAFVIAPMVIMSLHRTLVKSLITGSVSIMLFGMMLAWCSTADDISVFIATVGYAAFLAVFVAIGDEGSTLEAA